MKHVKAVSRIPSNASNTEDFYALVDALEQLVQFFRVISELLSVVPQLDKTGF